MDPSHLAAPHPPSSLGATPSRPLMVGRAAEIDRLRARLVAALAGDGGLVLIAGAAGIGKTTLAHLLAAEAASRGALVLRGGAYDLTATPPYGPWHDLATDPAARTRLPGLETALRAAAGAGGQSSLFDQIGQTLARAAADAPLFLLLDDLHWADPGSLDLLRFVARRAAALPILLVATYRPEDVGRRHPLAPLIPLLVRESGALRIEPAPLDDAAVRTLVDARYRLAAGDADRLVAYLRRHAEGNPLYLGELLRTLEAEGPLHHDAAGWSLADLDRTYVPTLLRQIIDSRLDRLGDDLRQPIEVAATIGADVPIALWTAVGDFDDDTVRRAASRAIDGHLLTASADGSRVRFGHALIRAALYEGVLPFDRRLWHQRAGAILAADPAADPDAVAYHLQQAADPSAVEWLVQAGDRAQRAYVWLTAADRFDAAQRLLAALPERARQRGWLLYRGGRLRRFSDPLSGIAPLEDAERIGLAIDDPVLAAYARADRGVLRCLAGDLRRGLDELVAGVATIDALPADHAPAGSDVATWVADALPSRQDAPTAAPPAAASASGDVRRGVLAIWLASVGRYADAAALATTLLDRLGPSPAAGLADRFAAGDAAFGLALAHAALGRPAEARRAFAQARQPAEATGHHFSLGWIAVRDLSQVIIPYQTDHLDERRRLAEVAESALGRGGVGVMPAGLSPRRGSVPLLIVEGRWREARRLAMDARGQGTYFTRQEAATSLAIVTARQGDHDLAWTQIRETLPDAWRTEPGGAIFHLALELIRVAADLTIEAASVDAARAWLEAHDRWLAWSGMTRDRPAGLLGWARYHRLVGDPRAARRAATEAAATARSPRQPLPLIAALRLLGSLDIAEGRLTEADRSLAAALELADACAAPFERALTLIEQAASPLAARRPSAAKAALAEAEAISRELGAEPTLTRIGILRQRLDGAPAVAPAGLSRREVEVLRLVAEGLTDAAVAERLSISPRTASQHLRSVYNKIGVSSRAAATRFAVEHQIV